jgi:hypothetical protein
MADFEAAYFDSGERYDTTSATIQPTKGRHMAGNPVPINEDDLLALAEALDRLAARASNDGAQPV